VYGVKDAAVVVPPSLDRTGLETCENAAVTGIQTLAICGDAGAADLLGRGDDEFAAAKELLAMSGDCAVEAVERTGQISGGDAANG